MSTPIHFWSGEYFGFITNDRLFSREGEYIGWLDANDVWSKNGQFIGELTDDNYILRRLGQPVKPIRPIRPTPPVPPARPVAPPRPARRRRTRGIVIFAKRAIRVLFHEGLIAATHKKTHLWVHFALAVSTFGGKRKAFL
jgi:hypothetical protein